MSRINVVALSESNSLTDIKTLCEHVRKHIKEGAVIKGYRVDRGIVLRLSNEVLVTELICVLHHRRHHFMARGINAEPITAELPVYVNEEQAHADNIAMYIVQLGGESNFNPGGPSTRSHSEYMETDGLVDTTEESLMVEWIAAGSYLEMIRYTGDRNPTTWCALEQILAIEEEHADELSDTLRDR